MLSYNHTLPVEDDNSGIVLTCAYICFSVISDLCTYGNIWLCCLCFAAKQVEVQTAVSWHYFLNARLTYLINDYLITQAGTKTWYKRRWLCPHMRVDGTWWCYIKMDVFHSIYPLLFSLLSARPCPGWLNTHILDWVWVKYMLYM